ncbi:MAG: hypothetical protein M1831_005037 [Alyxoria varia]|nr:MAG: hypothetical protein M1831_005037 [Alyxoria varia]
MSAQGDTRWRTSNAHQRNNPSRGGSGTSTPQQQQQQQGQQGQQRGHHTKNQSRNQNNANLADRSRSASGARGKGQGKPESPATPKPGQEQPPPFSESHVPVKNFNRDEVKGFLKSLYGGSRDAIPYKAGKGAEGPPPSPWGSTPSNMASGQNFFVQLSKQIAAQGQGG